MSMICFVVGLSRAQISALRATPSLAGDLVKVAQDERHKARMAEALNNMPPERREAAEAEDRAAIEQIPGAKEEEARIAEARVKLERLGPREHALDLAKSWHMLHYLFTGHIDTADAPGDTLLTGEELGEDVGYGPARLHSVEETQEFARFLDALDVPRLQRRLNYQDMLDMGVYAMPMGPGPVAEYESGLQAEVAYYFPRLQDYVTKMAQKQNGLLIWLS